MAKMESFDITSECDLQEVDNAVNQTLKEVGQRYDFRNVKVEVDFQRKENRILLAAPDEFKLKALSEVLQQKMVRRHVPVKNLKFAPAEAASLGTVRQTVDLQQGIPTDTARKIVKFLRDSGLKKVQGAIQGDQVRVSAPSRDTLQEVIRLLKEEEFGLELKFGNYRT
jgi:uncharacterized protein YajQ (UPF0234 family)